MTRQEFDVWIEQHYTDLLKVAKKRGAASAQDVVQTAVAAMYGTEGYLRFEHPWTWAVGQVRGALATERLSGSRRDRLQTETKRIAKTADSSHGWKRPAPRAE